MNDATTNETKKGGCVPLWQVAVLFIFLLASILVSTRMLGSSAHIPLLLATILATFMALGSGYKYADLEEGMAESIKSAAQAILLMLIVGIVVGLWILGHCSVNDILWPTDPFSVLLFGCIITDVFRYLGNDGLLLDHYRHAWCCADGRRYGPWRSERYDRRCDHLWRLFWR